MIVTTSTAATFTASSCSFVDVSNAVEMASVEDTVLIPAGDCAWTNTLYITNGTFLIGAGIGQTIIRDYQSAANHRLIQTFNAFPNSTRISSMTLHGGTNAFALINVGSITKTNIGRIDNIEFTNLIARGIEMDGWSLSVIDRCVFRGHPTLGAPTGISITGFGDLNISESGGATNSNPSWDTIPHEYGTTNCVVVEDCVFDWRAGASGANGAIDAYNGARFTIRNCIVTNVNIGAHGTDSGGTLRSAHSWECYNNQTFFSVSIVPYSFRGGSGVFYSNTVSSSVAGQNFIRIDAYRSSGTNIYNSPPGTVCCAPYGPITYTNIYGGKENEFGYPGYDQIGRTSPTIYGPTNTVQTLKPLYQWSNTFNGALGLVFANGTPYENVSPYDYIPNSTNIIKLDRDYFNNTVAPGYTALAYPHPLVTLQDSPVIPAVTIGSGMTLGNGITIR